MTIPQKLDDWQKEILEHDGNVLLCTGRQVGKTTVFSIKAGQYMINKPGSKIIVVSLTEDQAKLIISMILTYLERNPKARIARGRHKPTQNKITLKNGSQVIARPVGQTGDAVRGFTGDVLIIDEASGMNEYIFTASKPTLLTTAGQIWMCSTPRGKKGYFYEAFLNKQDRYKVFHISSEHVIKNRPISTSWTEKQQIEAIKFLAQEKEDLSEIRYGQEYLGLFLDELRQYFPDDLIQQTCILKRPPISRTDGNILGCDIARMGDDETTYEILNITDGKKIRHTQSIIRKKQYTSKTQQDIHDLDLIYNFNMIGIDAGSGSLGVGIYDNLMKIPRLKRKLRAMNNRAISIDPKSNKSQRIFKEDMYDNLLSMMEKGEILLLDDDNVIRSLKSIQIELSDNPNITKVKIWGDYSHITEGLIRAAWLAKKEKANKVFIFYI